MKVLFLLLPALLTVTSASPTQGDESGVSVARKQQDINHLLEKIYDRLRHPELVEAASTFDPEGDLTLYTDGGEAVRRLMSEVHQQRLLQKHHWFSLFQERQREEALMLFDVLIHCNSWRGFVNNAAYFRERVNEGQFVYALYVAVIHSDLASHVVLPPLYEITPHLFTNNEIIQKAYTAKMTQTPGRFNMSFTGTQKNREQRIAYFGEDIGLNVHHVTWHMDFPFWWQDSYGHHIDRKGELFFWVHHQLSARFDSERLSNWMNVVDELHWEEVISEGFAPHTSYKFGGEFPSRPDNIHFQDVVGVANVRDMIILERRIRDAIAHGYIIDEEGRQIDIMNEHGIDYLGNIIESSMYTSNLQYYGSLHNTAHIMLGRQGDPKGKYNLPPGVMEHFETATRDPSFFRLHKYIDNIFKEHKDILPPYTREELEFPGVAVRGIEIEGELKTYFEQFEFNLINAVDRSNNVEDVELSANVNRLNHQDFTYNVIINNDNEVDVLATIRIFLCPRADENGIEFTWDEGRWHCIETDKFWRKLTVGENTVTRRSTDSSVTVPDPPSLDTLQRRADAAVEGGQELHMEEYERSCGIPNRMLLPKGKTEGMDFLLMVAVTDGEIDTNNDQLDLTELGGTHAHCGVRGHTFPDTRPMGYPLDRRIPDKRVFEQVTNIESTFVKVFHNTQH
ncbi:hypothetical protein Pmani_037199 [Petrolisthes manimaculis]|uniref:Tyrosinase copper-binding domain-containing protein n=1 Tax=Petrolisthes manimaculis TaxID=1843537 RepID=A0AAE1TLE3_9EUCA|nr:hypothetical protein Pmani_037199 [Petrolisthes manimaculis]